MHVYMPTYIYIRIHTYLKIYIHTYAHIYTHTQANTYTNLYMHIHILKHISKFEHACIYLYIEETLTASAPMSSTCYNCQHSTSIEVQAIYTLLLKK